MADGNIENKVREEMTDMIAELFGVIVKDIDNLPKLYVFPLIAKAQLVKNQRPLL